MQRIRTLILILFCLLSGKSLSAQQLKTAELAYRKGHYAETLLQLKQAEEKGLKIGEYGLFLRIMSQRALLPAVDEPAFYKNMKQFDSLETLRDNCRNYLLLPVRGKIAAQRRQRVLDVEQSLKIYPIARVQFDEIMHLRNSQ